MQAFEKLPALKYALFLIFGVIAGKYCVFNPFIIPVFIILSFILFYIFRKKEFSSAFLFALIFFTGFLKAEIDFHYSSSDSVRNIPPTKDDSEIRLCGIISEPPQHDTNKIKFVFECEYVVSGKDSFNIGGNVLAYIFPDKKLDSGKALPLLNAGDEISAYGRLLIPKGERNPGGFDYRKYLELHDISRLFYIKGFDNYELISENNLNFFYDKIIYPVRNYSVRLIDSTIGGDEGAFLNGLVTGERKDISDDFKDKFVNAGVMHLIAVSGLNVGYIIIFLTLLLSFFRVKLVPKTIILIIALVFYCAFAGASASILRASLMGGLVLIAYVIQRKVSLLNLTGFSIIIIILSDARQLFDAGFILSYSAIFSMALFFDAMINLVPEKIKRKKFVFSTIIVLLTTVAAQIGTLPISAMYFGKVSIVSFITNIVAIPLSNFSLALGFLQLIFVGIAKLFALLISLISSGIASAVFPILNFPSVCIADVNQILLKVQLIFIYFFGSLKFAYTTFFNFNLLQMFLYFLIMALIFTSHKNNFAYRTIISSLLIFIYLIFRLPDTDKMKIVFFDAGEGDCTLISTPNGKHILIDAGTEYSRSTIVPYLNRNRINKIDYLIITHPHADHIGGLPYITANIRADTLVCTALTALNKNIKEVISDNDIPEKIVSAGNILTIENNIKLYFLNPPLKEIYGSDDNADCLVFKLKYKNFDALFTGDLNAKAEEYLVNKAGCFLKSDLLKVPHHGSRTSSTPKFLIATLPYISVISCGANNIYHHPSPFTLLRYNVINSKILRTDVEGAIIITTDGYKLQKEDWN